MRARPRATGGRRDRGAQIVEFAIYLPFLLVAMVLASEVFFTFTAIERIESAARAGARVAGPQGVGSANATARAALPGWLDDATIKTGFRNGGVYTRVSVETPIMWKSAPFHITLTRQVEMPNL